jgi:PAS domain S-box-containing protein
MIPRYESDLDAGTHLAVLQAVAETLTESVMITEADEGVLDPKIVYVNPAFARLTGYTAAEAVGRTPKLLQGGLTDRGVLNRLKVEIRERHQWKGRTYNYTKDGKPFLMEWEIVPIHDTAGRLRFYLTVQRRVEPKGALERRRMQALRRWSEQYA